MGLGDLFKSNEIVALKEQIEKLEKERAYWQEKYTPEMLNVDYAKERIEELKREISDINTHKDSLLSELNIIKKEIDKSKSILVETNESILMQEFGLYEPKFKFANSDQYKSKLLEIRAMQKDLIKEKKAVTATTNWTVNNSAAQGRKMVNDMQKLLLRAFNSECDEVVEKVKFNNIDASIKRITNARDTISKLGQIINLTISPQYYKLKIDELHLAYEYQLKKEEEKEALRQAREEMREQAKLQKELEEERKRIEKDKKHYKNALEQAKKRLEIESDETKKADLLEKIFLFETQLNGLEEDLKAVDYRESNHRAGYVYVISNIGAFGEDVYKIGMTRRLDPMDRVDELGDASVPFKFDVHAMIFSDDAPALETALHHAFEDKKVNMVNNRREFFKVSLAEIKNVVKDNYDKTVDFIEIPPAEQYRQTLLLKEVNIYGKNIEN